MEGMIKRKKLRVIEEKGNKWIVKYIDPELKKSNKISLSKNFIKKRVEAGLFEIDESNYSRRIL